MGKQTQTIIGKEVETRVDLRGLLAVAVNLWCGV